MGDTEPVPLFSLFCHLFFFVGLGVGCCFTWGGGGGGGMGGRSTCPFPLNDNENQILCCVTTFMAGMYSLHLKCCPSFQIFQISDHGEE